MIAAGVRLLLYAVYFAIGQIQKGSDIWKLQEHVIVAQFPSRLVTARRTKARPLSRTPPNQPSGFPLLVKPRVLKNQPPMVTTRAKMNERFQLTNESFRILLDSLIHAA